MITSSHNLEVVFFLGLPSPSPPPRNAHKGRLITASDDPKVVVFLGLASPSPPPLNAHKGRLITWFRQSQSCFLSGAAQPSPSPAPLNAHEWRLNVAPIIGSLADTCFTDDSCSKDRQSVKCTRQAELAIECTQSSEFKPWALKTSTFRVDCQSYKNAGMAVKSNSLPLVAVGSGLAVRFAPK